MRISQGEKVKTQISLVDVNPEKNMEILSNPFKSSGILYDHTSFRISDLYFPSTERSRAGIVCGDVAKYTLKISVGSEEYDYIVLTNYVKEKSPWKTDVEKNLIILPGQALTEGFYSDMAIYYAQQGYSTYILDRRETNIPANETDFSYMEKWTIDEHLSDMYKGIIVSRYHTAFLSNKPEENIETTAIGHSHGALILTAYEASEYTDFSLGSLERIVPVDIIIKYDPKYSELIEAQAQEFYLTSKSIESGAYNATNMGIMMQIANLALADPEGKSSIQPNFTNRQFFRLIASQTHTFNKYPYTPDYHYWSGDLNGLYYVDENRLLNLTLTGGAVPYSPKYLDQYMAGLMGNVDGFEIDFSKIDSPVLYIGLGGGFSDYGSWWYKKEVGRKNERVTTINWNSQGHGSIALDYNSPELWALIHSWIEKN